MIVRKPCHSLFNHSAYVVRSSLIFFHFPSCKPWVVGDSAGPQSMFLSTHSFWLGSVLMVILGTQSSTSFPINPTTAFVNMLMLSWELRRNMSLSVTSRASCKVATDWSDQRHTYLHTGASCFSLRCILA